VASARVVLDALDRLPPGLDPGTLARAESVLTAHAQVHDTRTVKVLATRLEEVVDPEGADERLGARLEAAQARAARSTLFELRHDETTQTTTGTFRVPLRTGLVLDRAVQSLLNPARPGGPGGTDAQPVPLDDAGDASGAGGLAGLALTASERRAQGFVELVDRLRATDLPRTGGALTTVVVTMALTTLTGGPAPATCDTGERLAASTARRLAARCGVIPAVLGTRSQVLDLGRTARLFSRAQRLAMTVQQHGTCAVEGCDRPVSWGEAHHLTAWHEGGTTDLTNAVILCRRHHTLADHPRYRTTLTRPGHIHIHRRT